MRDARMDYTRRVQEKHQRAFALFTKVAAVFDKALSHPHQHNTVTGRVLDMLMLQAHKSYTSVALVAQHGLMEDSATLTRRLMELGIQSYYIGRGTDNQARAQKAGTYLVFLWRQLTEKNKLRLPLEERSGYEENEKQYGQFLKLDAKRWGPLWKIMFADVGAEELYDEDYSYLSAIAHGSVDHQVFAFAGSTVSLHNDQFQSVIIQYASRYYMMVGEQWNQEFHLIPDDTWQPIAQEVLAFSARESS